MSIGCTYRGKLEHAIVLDPVRREEFIASRGQGAQLNGHRIRVSELPGLEGALLGTGIPFKNHCDDQLEPYSESINQLASRCAGIRRGGAASLDLAYVAAGRLDAFWEIGLSPWDLAAGVLLIREAGGLVADIDGSENYMESGNIVCETPSASSRSCRSSNLCWANPRSFSYSPDRPMNPDNIRIVLVHTTHPGNIGGVARAMKNMGLHRLYLVAPASFPMSRPIDVRFRRTIYSRELLLRTRWRRRLATASSWWVPVPRERRIPWPLLDARQCAARVAEASAAEQVAVVFGREDRGLTNEELKQCNLHLNIPTSREYSSLNLAMAVQIVAYELRMLRSAPEKPAVETENWDTPFASRENMERFYAHLEETLIDIDFLDPAARVSLCPVCVACTAGCAWMKWN